MSRVTLAVDNTVTDIFVKVCRSLGASDDSIAWCLKHDTGRTYQNRIILSGDVAFTMFSSWLKEEYNGDVLVVLVAGQYRQVITFDSQEDRTKFLLEWS